ncbi:MAG: hypothetical protein WD627_00775, partial [Actinomycetota bacterium]
RAGGGLAFSPVAEWFREPAVLESASKLEPVWLNEVGLILPALQPLSRDHASQSFSVGWRRRRLFEALSRAVVAAPQPLLLLLDDAQWCDPETLDWLHYLLRHEPSAGLLVLLTVRSEEQADNPTLAELLLELRGQGVMEEVNVGALDLPATSRLACQILGSELGEAESDWLFEASEGHPLFVVEVARAGLRSGWQEERAAFEGGQLPPKAQAVISARLSQLTPPARELAALAATVGRAFSSMVLAEAGELGEEMLVLALDELWRRRIIREHGYDEYDFSHDRIREVAYAELGPAPRRLLHRRVAEALERLQEGGMEVASSQIAQHFERSGQIARAVHFYERGAQAARRVSASGEAIRLLRHALSLLIRLPTSPERDRMELALQYALSAPLNAALGYASPELEASLQRLGTLGERLGQGSAVVASLVGQWAVNFVRGHSSKALESSSLAVERAAREPQLLPESHFALGGALFSLARFDEAVDSLELSRTGEMANSSRSLVLGADLAVFRDSYAAHCLWHLGRSDEMIATLLLATARAEELGDPYNIALANAYGALARQFLGDVTEAVLHADTATDLCERYGYAYYGQWGTIIRGWAKVMEGDAELGLAAVERGLAELRSVGAAARLPYYLSLQAQALMALGRLDEADEVLEHALDLSSCHQESWWDAELYRLQGELRRRTEDAGGAEPLFRRSLEVARQQGSKALALRTS